MDGFTHFAQASTALRRIEDKDNLAIDHGILVSIGMVDSNESPWIEELERFGHGIVVNNSYFFAQLLQKSRQCYLTTQPISIRMKVSRQHKMVMLLDESCHLAPHIRPEFLQCKLVTDSRCPLAQER